MDMEVIDQEEQSVLRQAVETWLASLPEGMLTPQEGGLLLLEVEMLELAARRAHQALLQALLERPDLLAPGQRVWLRLHQLPASFELCLPQALETMRVAPGTLMSVHGVVAAASALFQQPVSRSFACAVCSKICTLHTSGAPPPCCGRELHEVEQARVMVPGQVLFLIPDSPLPGSPSTQLGGCHLAVHLTDDLAGQAQPGDHVLVTGSGRFHSSGSMAMAPGTHLPLTVGQQLEACNIEVLHPTVLTHHPRELGAAALPHLAALNAANASIESRGAGLEAALRVLDAALPVAASPLLRMAVLLSAAAAGTGSTQLDAGGPGGAGLGAEECQESHALMLRTRGATACSRNQVNIMLTAAAPEPHIQRFLRAAAATLCDHSVVASVADPKRILPTLDAKFVAPTLGVEAPLAVGGQLAEAGPGVLLLSSSCLDPRRAIALGQYMAGGEAALQPGCPELSVPVRASLWTVVHEQDLSKSGQVGPSAAAVAAGSGPCGALSLTERIINRFSHPFFSQHDILLAAGPETDDEVDAMVEALLGSRTGTGNGSGDAGALRALQHHLAVARAAPQPALSSQATALLSAYFLHLRAAEGAQHGALASLVRVAAASARLRHSTEVAAVPDAALAVALLEEKLLAAGAGPSFWPRWREELQQCTPLVECLRGLAAEACEGLGMAWARCGGVGSDQKGMYEPEE